MIRSGSRPANVRVRADIRARVVSIIAAADDAFSEERRAHPWIYRDWSMKDTEHIITPARVEASKRNARKAAKASWRKRVDGECKAQMHRRRYAESAVRPRSVA